VRDLKRNRLRSFSDFVLGWWSKFAHTPSFVSLG
jgi:hypothetical protein